MLTLRPLRARSLNCSATSPGTPNAQPFECHTMAWSALIALPKLAGSRFATSSNSMT
jgi:hypothetical protein